MSLNAVRLVVALGLVALLAPAAAGADRAVPGKDNRPADAIVAPHGRTAIPCDDPRQDLALEAGQQLAFTDTTAGTGLANGYACEPGWDESGPEHIYILRPSTDLILDTWLLDNDPDLDLILLSDCDTDSCLAAANSEISAELTGGQAYYLVIDGYQGAVGEYDLVLETRTIGLPVEICEGGATVLDEFSGDAPTETLALTLFEQPNLVSIYDCSPTAILGGERWFEVRMAGADTTYQDDTDIGSVELNFTVIPASEEYLDLAIWVFDGCGPDAVCLAYVDEFGVGGTEILEYINLALDQLTIYVAVDCVLPPATESEGSCELQFFSVVPTSQRSWSGVRELFR